MNDAVWGALCIAVPVYSRPRELEYLLETIAQMTVLPGEVLLCEDCSPDRKMLGEIASRWLTVLAAKGCRLRYHENERNLGYDGNLRALFARATTEWILLLGNDDAMLPDAVPALRHFVSTHPGIRMVSRTFVRFKSDVHHIEGVTRLSDHDRVYERANSSAGFMLHLCGFVGGLLVDREWAESLATDRFDGTLYYQMYLAAEAYCGTGIGYIAAPLVGSRVGNPPLFGAASAEKKSHIPGSYSPRARAAMWSGILRICSEVQQQRSVPLVASVRRELSGRQSFHVFELVAVQGRGATLELAREFHKIGLMNHPLPWVLSVLGLVLGRRIRTLFAAVRSAQKWRAARA